MCQFRQKCLHTAPIEYDRIHDDPDPDTCRGSVLDGHGSIGRLTGQIERPPPQGFQQRSCGFKLSHGHLFDHLLASVPDRDSQHVVALCQAPPRVLPALMIETVTIELEIEVRADSAQDERLVTPDEVGMLHGCQREALEAGLRVGAKYRVLRARPCLRRAKSRCEPSHRAAPHQAGYGAFSDRYPSRQRAGAQPGHRTGRDEAVTAESEEVIVSSRHSDTQQLGPHLCDCLLHRPLRWFAVDVRRRSGLLQESGHPLTVHFAVAVQWQAGHAHDEFRHHRLREVPLGPFAYGRVKVWRMVFRVIDGGKHADPRSLLRVDDGCDRPPNAGILLNRGFDLAEVNAITGDLDLEVCTPENLQLAVVSPAHEVTGPIPAVPVPLNELLRSQLVVVAVAAVDTRPADPELARGPVWAITLLSIDDPHFLIAHRMPIWNRPPQRIDVVDLEEHRLDRCFGRPSEHNAPTAGGQTCQSAGKIQRHPVTTQHH